MFLQNHRRVDMFSAEELILENAMALWRRDDSSIFVDR